jgi:hypothetical protein
MRDENSLGGVLLLGVVGAGVYWYMTRPTPPDLSSPSAIAAAASAALRDVTTWASGAAPAPALGPLPPVPPVPLPLPSLPTEEPLPAAAPVLTPTPAIGAAAPLLAAPLVPVDREMLAGLYNAYSPAFGPDGQLYLGGWVTDAEALEFLTALQVGADPWSIPGPDKIFATAHGETPHLVFEKRGYSVNDPSFQGTTMLYTQLSNAAQVAGGRAIFEQAEIGRAVLINGTWVDLGTDIAATTAAGGGHGAWLPTIAGDYVFFASGGDDFSSSINYRQPIDAAGVPVGVPEHLTFPDNLQLANLDVVFRGAGDWALIGNTLDQHQLVYLRSTDGLNFTMPFVLLADADHTLLTPEFDLVSPSTFSVLYGRDGHTIERLGPLAFAMTQAPTLGPIDNVPTTDAWGMAA